LTKEIRVSLQIPVKQLMTINQVTYFAFKYFKMTRCTKNIDFPNDTPHITCVYIEDTPEEHR